MTHCAMNSMEAVKRLAAEGAAIAASAVALAVCGAGCAVGPDYVEPSPGAMPEALPAVPGQVPGRAAGAAEAGGGAVGASSWYDGFGDGILMGLLETARTNSIDVLRALKRVEASRASLAAARAEFWPSVGFSASTSKTKRYNPDGDSERSSLGFDASWEIDAFGRLRRGAEAARAEFAAMEFTLEDALVTLHAEIAAEYVNLRLQEELCRIAAENIEISEADEGIAKAKFEAGTASELDWLSARAQAESARAAAETARASRLECSRRLEQLCSLPPGGGIAMGDGGIPEAPPTPAAIPSDLLRLRPDVRRAERAYAAALARVGVAVASYYPSVSIGAGFSLSSESFADWGDAVRSLNFGPSLSWSLLSFGRTRARVAQARAAAEEAALEYRSAVLSAFHEVEGAALELDRDARREPHVLSNIETRRKACAIASKMFEEGLGEYRDVLSARQAFISARREAADLRANVSLKRIALQKSLGRR